MFTHENVAAFRHELQTALNEVAKRNGIKAAMGKITYNDGEFRCKLTVTPEFAVPKADVPTVVVPEPDYAGYFPFLNTKLKIGQLIPVPRNDGGDDFYMVVGGKPGVNGLVVRDTKDKLKCGSVAFFEDLAIKDGTLDPNCRLKSA